ncbi:MAG TPA: hypothetical protein VGR20_02645 [Acidimicrobiia bacterium]|nr:hypothetical protein [Acidimicrobiia bacterium]
MEVFAHDAVVAMPPEDDIGAPGAAITVALCGHWEHEPPCPLAAHHTGAERDGDTVRLRVLFAAAPDDEPEVRRRINDALSRAELQAPDGAIARWRLVSTRAGAVHPDEADHARRLAESSGWSR